MDQVMLVMTNLPEIIAMPLTGHAAYLHWIKQETAQDENE